MSKKTILIIFFAYLLSGCSSFPVKQTSISTNQSSTPTRIINATQTKPIEIKPTITIRPSETPITEPSSTNWNPIKHNCVEFDDSSSNKASYTGNILLLDEKEQLTTYPYLFNINKLSMIEFPNANKYNNFIVSPNRNNFAAISNDNDAIPYQVTIWDTKGNVKGNSILSQDWVQTVTWLDNEKILLAAKPEDSKPSRLGILNPFTQELKYIDSILPGYFNPYPYIRWDEYSLSGVTFDPDLRFAVYPKGLTDGSFFLSLFDVSDNTIILDIPANMRGLGNTPRWAPSGEGFIINQSLSSTIPFTSSVEYDQELFFIDRSGVVTRLTYLTDEFNKVAIGNYQWSPDSQHIALWSYVGPSENPDSSDNSSKIFRLVILDFNTREITDICVPTLGLMPPPIWSYNGNQILVQSQQENEDNKMILINLNNNNAFVVKDNSQPLGWLVEP